jgi:hypothetical protein
MTDNMDMGAAPPEESGNRIFLIGAIILGGIFIVALISIFALYFLTQGAKPAGPQPQDLTTTMLFQLGSTQTAAAGATQTRQAQASQTAAITPTATKTPTPTHTPTVTITPVVFSTVAQPSDTFTATTVGGGAGGTGTPPATTGTANLTPGVSPTALPQTGFGESSGFIGLLILGGGSLIVIILARQARLGVRNR